MANRKKICGRETKKLKVGHRAEFVSDARLFFRKIFLTIFAVVLDHA